MATDALRLELAAIHDATHAYWVACTKAENHLENVLKTAANAAHKRNDGAEEQACLEAAKDAHMRYMAAYGAGNETTGPLPPFRFGPSK